MASYTSVLGSKNVSGVYCVAAVYVRVTFTMMWTLVFTVCRQISSWCPSGHLQVDSLEPIVGPTSLRVKRHPDTISL